MHTGKLVFAQLMGHLSLHTFRQCVAKYPSRYPTLKFSPLDQFLSMAFAQLTYRESLRDIETCLRTRHDHHRSMLERIPLGAVSQSQGCRQDAYAPRFAWQYSHLYSYQRRQDARSGTKSQKGLAATPATYQLPRYRKQQRSGLYYQPLRFTCIDHRSALPLSLAGQAVLQVDQTASSYQTLLRHLRERGKNADMDGHLCIRPSRYREEKAQDRDFTLHNITDTEPDSVRKNTTRSTT